MLGVSRASAGEMLKRLEAEGLIERGEHKEAMLTPSGRERAERVVRKHRIIERLLTDFMGYTPAEAHVHADELGDTLHRRDDRADRARSSATPTAARTAGRSTPSSSRPRTASSPPLADLEPGTHATIVRLAEHDGELLHWFYDEGFVPGAELEVQRRRSRPPGSSPCV